MVSIFIWMVTSHLNGHFFHLKCRISFEWSLFSFGWSHLIKCHISFECIHRLFHLSGHYFHLDSLISFEWSVFSFGWSHIFIGIVIGISRLSGDRVKVKGHAQVTKRSQHHEVFLRTQNVLGSDIQNPRLNMGDSTSPW